MKKWMVLVLLFGITASCLAEDVIIAKNDKKYYGKVIKIVKEGFVVRTVEGTVIVLPKDKVSQIIRGKQILDLDEGMRYYVETRRPYLPFLVLAGATGVYSIKKFQDYKKHHDEAERQKLENAGPDYTNLEDQSRRDLAWGIVSGIFSVGSVYIALKPMEVRVPMGKINLTTTPNGISLALHF